MSDRESIIRYLEQQATDWEDHDLKVSRTWSKAARHVRERRDIAPEDLVRVSEPPRSGFAEALAAEHCSTCSSPKGRGLVCTGAVCGGQVCLHQHVPCPTCSADFPNDSERSKAQRKGD